MSIEDTTSIAGSELCGLLDHVRMARLARRLGGGEVAYHMIVVGNNEFSN